MLIIIIILIILYNYIIILYNYIIILSSIKEIQLASKKLILRQLFYFFGDNTIYFF